MRFWLYRLARFAPWLWLIVPLVSFARGGGGEHYSSNRSSSRSSGHGSGGGGSGGGDGDGLGEMLLFVAEMTFRYPKVMCPLLVVFAVGWYFYQSSNDPTVTTRKALERREAETRTLVSARDVDGWVNALKLRDPDFELLALLDKVKALFLQLQDAWFKRDLTPLRPFLSDATYQRFNVQLKLMNAQGIRDALADIQVLDLQIIGLDQSAWFDTVHIRVKAQMRDTDVVASASDAEAIAAARRVPIEPFIEVWSFVRKPGARTKIGADLSQGKCPNCGAPFRGGATNSCEYCGAVVNSGNYDWTLSEITQGVEHIRGYAMVDGLKAAREADPALNLEILEDRASLIFWKWIDAQSSAESRRLAKLATEDFTAQLDEELATIARAGRRKVFLECAVGGVTTRQLHRRDGYDRVDIEIRWSARMGTLPAGTRPPHLPTAPQRWVFSLIRKEGAQTRVDTGMATDRCASCGAALTDSASPSCDYCGVLLSGGERDWVLAAARTYEAWNAAEDRHFAQVTSHAHARDAEVILDPGERERLLYMMASMAAADGSVDEREKRLLRLCAERWSVPWSQVEATLRADPGSFMRLPPKQSPEAETFLRTLVKMALVDGRIDRKERQMLESMALRLGLPDKLPELLHRR